MHAVTPLKATVQGMLQRPVTLNIYVKYPEILKMGCAQLLLSAGSFQ